MLTVQDVRLDPATRRVWRGDREIGLSRKEFELLHALMSSAGTIVSRDQLMRDVWDTTFWTSSKTIDVHLGWVRRKLGDVFGPPVNLAARLTAVARRNRIMIDATTAGLLPEDEFETRAMPARPVRGFGLVEPVTVRRA